MKTIKKLILTSLALFCLTNVAEAQKKVEANVQADIVTKYMWRGLELGGVSIQPQAKVSWRGLGLRAFGSKGIDNNDTEEFDLELSYNLAGFNIGVIDYWKTGIDVSNRYLYYDRDKGPHKFEGNLGYTCKYFSLQAYCTFWGIDDTPYKYMVVRNELSDDEIRVEEAHNRAYSTYIEASIPFRMGGLNWTLTGGMTPFESGGPAVEYGNNIRYTYADGPACVKAALRATKELSVGDVKLPIYAEIHLNPYMQTGNFMMGVSVIPF